METITIMGEAEEDIFRAGEQVATIATSEAAISETATSKSLCLQDNPATQKDYLCQSDVDVMPMPLFNPLPK